MKLFFITLSLILFVFNAQSSTLQEDYQQIAPDMEMLMLQSSASLMLLEPYIAQGNSVAAFLAGSIYEEGQVVDKDEKKAFELYLKASDKNPQAQMAVANMYVDGRGTEHSIPQAMRYYEKVLNSDDEKLKETAALKIIILNQILENQKNLETLEIMALSGDPQSMKILSQFCLSKQDFICSYTWLALCQEHPAYKDSVEQLQDALETMMGEMTMSQISQAEDEIEKLKPIVFKK